MPTPDEMKIVKILEDEDGETTAGKIAAKMRLDSVYTKVILRAMGKNDLVDISRNGKVRIGTKGWAALGKKAEQPDGLKRYLEDRAKRKAF